LTLSYSVATGYHRNGILLSPYCAHLLTNTADGTATESEVAMLSHFKVDRFATSDGKINRAAASNNAR